MIFQDRLSGLFPEPAGRAVTRRATLLALAGVGVATVASLSRTTGAGPLQSILEEDARDVMTVALDTSSAAAVLEPISGYFVIGPRLLGELATVFPVGWAAAVLSISAAVISALLALQVYVASGVHFGNQLGRLAVAAPMMFAPVAENRMSEIYNRPVCLHFFAMYALFWVLLWTPTTRWGRIGALTSVGLTAFSTILIVGYLPLAAVRLLVRRDRYSLGLFGLAAGGAAVHLGNVYFGDVGRANRMRLNPFWALEQYVAWAVPESVLGFRATSGLTVNDRLWDEALSRNIGVVLLAWLVVLLIVALAVVGARRGLLRPRWLLAAALGAQSVGVLALEIMANGWISQRYLMAPALLLLAALVTLLLPAPGANLRQAGVPLAAFAVLLVVVGAFNYRWDNTNRHKAPLWTEQVERVAVRCQQDPQLEAVTVWSGPRTLWSYVVVPCHEVRDGKPACQSPSCVRIEPPPSLSGGSGRRPGG